MTVTRIASASCYAYCCGRRSSWSAAFFSRTASLIADTFAHETRSPLQRPAGRVEARARQALGVHVGLRPAALPERTISHQGCDPARHPYCDLWRIRERQDLLYLGSCACDRGWPTLARTQSDPRARALSGDGGQA